MAVVPPLPPPPDIPPPELHVYSHFARACISSPPLASFPSVFRLVVFPPVDPVVTHRPPELTGGRCHAAPGVLSSVPMFVGVPPRPVRLALLGSGVGGGA